MGVIWVYFLVRVTIRAAAFCNLWILASLVWGKLYKSALPKSKRDEINAWTIFSAADCVRYLRMKPRFRSWYHTDLHMLDIWEDMVSVESSITPKLRQESETPMTVSGITIELISVLLKLTFEPNKTNSVFSLFSLRECEFIQTATSLMQASKLRMAPTASLWFGLKGKFSSGREGALASKFNNVLNKNNYQKWCFAFIFESFLCLFE